MSQKHPRSLFRIEQGAATTSDKTDKDYPSAIVDLKTTREAALAAYKSLSWLVSNIKRKRIFDQFHCKDYGLSLVLSFFPLRCCSESATIPAPA